MSNKNKTIKKFSEVYKGGRSLNSNGQLTDLVGEEIIIHSVEFSEMGSLGKVAIVEVERENGEIEHRHTFSSVLIKQLNAVKDELPIKTVIRRQKRYYTFT